MDVIAFINGFTLIIAGLGFAVISFINRTCYAFLDKFLYLGIFLCLTGLVKWEDLFFSATSTQYSEFSAAALGHGLFVVLAACFLAVFAIEMSLLDNARQRYLRYIFAFGAVLFFTYFFVYLGFNKEDILNWNTNIENAARNFILLPGGILAAYAVFIKTKSLNINTAVRWSSYILTAAMAVYAIFAGFLPMDFPEDNTNKITEIILIFTIFGAGMSISYYLHNYYFHSRLEVRDAIILQSERDRIGRDIHDGAIQSLYGVAFKLGHLKNTLSKQKSDFELEYEIMNLQNSINEIIHDIRSYIYNNFAEEYKYHDLEEAVNSLIGAYRNATDINIKFFYSNRQMTKLRKEVTVNLYFIVKEALANIIKHAQARTAIIKIEIETHRLYLTIQDDGVGIKTGNSSLGMGLTTMKNRVEHVLGGIFTIGQNDGTLLEIEIPLREENLNEQKSFVS